MLKKRKIFALPLWSRLLILSGVPVSEFDVNPAFLVEKRLNRPNPLESKPHMQIKAHLVYWPPQASR